jgi:hypothetical protein
LDSRTGGLVLIGLAFALAVIGLLVLSGALSWFGHLPGDIRIHGRNMRVYVPLTSMLLASALLTLLFSLLRRFVN